MAPLVATSSLSAWPLSCAFLVMSCTAERTAYVTSAEMVQARATPGDSDLSAERIDDILPISDSTLAISVDAGREIWIAGWDGMRRRVVARRGRGPGEVEGAVWLVRSADDRIAAIDVLLRRVQLWTTAGDYIGGWNYDLPTITGAWGLEDGLMLRATGMSSRMDLISLDNAGGVRTARSLPSRAESSRTSCRYCPAAVRMDGTVLLAVSDTSYTFLVGTLSSDSLTAIAGPPIPAIRAPDATRDSIARLWRGIDARLASRGSPAETRERVRSMANGPGRSHLRRFLPRGIHFSRSGALFAQRTVAPADSAEIDEFDSHLVYKRTLRLAPSAVLRGTTARGILVTETANAGQQRLIEYVVRTTDAPDSVERLGVGIDHR